MNMSFRIVKRQDIYRDDVLGLRQDTVLTPTGTRITRRVFEYQPACAIVLVDPPSERVLLVRHYRHPVERYLWDLPGGMVAPGETSESSIVRELGEETGYTARHLKLMISFHPEPAFSDHRISLFLGVIDPTARASGEREPELVNIRWFALKSALELIHSGQVASSWTIIGLLLCCGEYFRSERPCEFL